jgi:membrane protein
MTRDEPASETPAKLDRRSWWAAIRRTGKEFREDNLTDWAAALTYYAVLSIFPAIIVLVSVLGLIGTSVTKPLLDNLGGFAPGPARSIMANALEGLGRSRGGAGILFVAGLVGAIWSASGYVAGFMRASNAIWDVPEGRPIWKTLPLRVGVTVLMLVLLTVSAVAVVFTGPLADRIGKLIGLSSVFVTAWDVAKWPVLVLVVAVMFSILYYAAPNVRQPGFRWVTPGGVMAVVVWMAASALFALYVGNFGSYNKTYGTLGGVISFLVWLWISNVALLLGAELNAELERGRQMQTGHPADREPYLPLRDEPKHG